MTVQFMVEDNECLTSEMEYKIVESYYPTEYPFHGYEIYQVEVDDFRSIRVLNVPTGIEYQADEATEYANADGTVYYYVSVWSPIDEGGH